MDNVKTKQMFMILTVTLGWLGVHRFYVGHYGRGIFYPLLLPVSLFFVGFDLGTYAFMSEEKFNAKFNKPKEKENASV